MNVLVVDDENSARRSLERIIQKLGDVSIHHAASLCEARIVLQSIDVDVALVDMRLNPEKQDRDGLTLLQEIRADSSAVTIVVSGSDDLSQVRAAMRLGASDYLLKDEISDELLLPILEAIRANRALEREVRTLRARRDVSTAPGLVGTSRAMQRLRTALRRISTSDRPVLVLGPTGSGKELVVRAIHAEGAGADQPFMDLNCGALPAPLVESQLFGHERGAFTGADRKHIGLLRAVGRGTLFLDEIAELPLELQAKLLRVLEAGSFRPLGSTFPEKFEGRVVAATHADLEERVARGDFREDLYYRLNVLEVRVPPLAERREDIPALIAHFVSLQSRALSFSECAVQALTKASWPGNVRQLRNVIDRIAAFSPEDVVTAETVVDLLPNKSRPSGTARMLENYARLILQLPETNKLEVAETALIEEAMRQADGNKTAAARLLGVHRKAVGRRVERDDVGLEPLLSGSQGSGFARALKE